MYSNNRMMNADASTHRFKDSLALNRKTDTRSIYNAKTVIHEHVDMTLMQAYLTGVEDKKFTTDEAKSRGGFESAHAHVRKYIDSRYDARKGFAKTKLCFAKHKWGRVQPTDHLSLSVLHRPTRHGLCEPRYIDFDLKNASQNILRLACQQRGINTPLLDAYCDNREPFLEEVREYHNVSRDAAKQLFIAESFGGSYKSWRESHNVPDELPNMPGAKDMETEYATIIDSIYEENQHIIDDVIKADSHKYDKYATPTAKTAAKKRTCASIFYQTIEKLMQECMVMHLVNERGFALEDIVPCQDGFMVLKDKAQGVVTSECEAVCAAAFGFSVPLVEKPFDEAVVIPIMLPCTSPGTATLVPTGGAEGEDWLKNFRVMCVEFEKTHALIANKGVYVKQTPDGIVLMSKQHLHTTYGNMSCGMLNGSPVSFIAKWTSPVHPDIRTFSNVGLYPDVSRCPADILNMWSPFGYERMGPEFTPQGEAYARFKDHIRILVGREEHCVEHFLDWLAHALQYPMEKSTCPVFISKRKGAGKSVLVNKYMARIFGAAKIFETQTPSRDVWGSFNGMMAEKFIVNLDELTRKETLESDGRIRGLITSPTITINQKGAPQYEIPSYHRFIVTTNHEEGGINSDKGERRYDIYRCSEERCDKTDDNRAYFRQLVEDAEDDDVILTIVDALMQRNVERNFLSTNVVASAYQNELNEAARPAIELWLQDFVGGIKEDVADFSSSDLFMYFTGWCADNNFKCEGMTSPKFNIRLSNLFRDGGKESKYFATRNSRAGGRVVKLKTINVIGLKTEFGIL